MLRIGIGILFFSKCLPCPTLRYIWAKQNVCTRNNDIHRLGNKITGQQFDGSKQSVYSISITYNCSKESVCTSYDKIWWCIMYESIMSECLCVFGWCDLYSQKHSSYSKVVCSRTVYIYMNLNIFFFKSSDASCIKQAFAGIRLYTIFISAVSKTPILTC